MDERPGPRLCRRQRPAGPQGRRVADVTGRQRAEQAIEQAKLDADRANLAKSEFLSKMSHELRTPLNAILGFGQLLELDDLTSEQSEVVKDIVDLIRPLAAERQLTIQVLAPPDPDLTVQADRQRLKQVLLNLASNAVKYNRHAGTIRVACQATPDGRVVVAVQDTGPGLSADKMSRLFNPFDRLGAEETQVQGTGMGLALSKGLMEAMGGDLTAESVEGKGTTFTVELAELAGQPGSRSGVPSRS